MLNGDANECALWVTELEGLVDKVEAVLILITALGNALSMFLISILINMNAR